ncbi:hypothetical protein UREG_02463 [Uncinocarpus reesii 1704]|uniref:Diphthine--ammonia ligase n=1 Tax=Uncinocarpus reesii (strain UAMH 1704) TaxID=336963 RepID=C4JG65_UNCRE|nr:uncharacterized protein UREG_02463 [Uncinocarpus reesii 1704]EEP77614.1 hypothetical protein UREG_02463 [Uncinocarpus reesii 1704]
MPQKLNVVALISGGKDSLYSILHCLKNGHNVVALANLHPPLKPAGDAEVEDEGVDMDSYMYQTIGHSIIPLYQEALGIPLYRREISGTAVDTGRDYQTPEKVCAQNVSGQDETECLFDLLRHVMDAHPEINAVSAGAILSTYQRTRIENIAGRLGLIPLAWLWMYPYLAPPVGRTGLSADSVGSVTGLLEDMAACECEARIIKVASGGLDEEMLWENVSSKNGRMRRELVKKMGMMLEEGVEGAVLGEGGEYESLALDGPRELWRKKIEVEDIVREKGEGGVAFLRFKGAKCVEKTRSEAANGLSELPVPQLFDGEFKQALERVLENRHKYVAARAYDNWTTPGAKALPIEIFQSRIGKTLVISNLSASEAGIGAAAQMNAIGEKFISLLRLKPQGKDAATLSPDDIIFTTILLRSMDDFGPVNSIYGSMFKRPNPPARVTVACGDSFPSGVDILVSFLIDLGSSDNRTGLHVQSRSYWAPANIGPYSQAIGVPFEGQSRFEQDGGVVYIAGQIPLDPSSMELARPETGSGDRISIFTHHATLSLQHLWRIGRAMKVQWWLGAVAFIAKGDEIPAKVVATSDIWERMTTPNTLSDEDEDEESTLDAWDIKYGRKQDLSRIKPTISRLPDFEIVGSPTKVAPFLAVEVDELPRGSDIEWQGLGIRSAHTEITEENLNGIYISHSLGPFGEYVVVGIEKGESTDAAESVQKAMDLARTRAKEVTRCHTIIYDPLFACRRELPGQAVPCRSVWGRGGREFAAAIVLHAKSF